MPSRREASGMSDADGSDAPDDPDDAPGESVRDVVSVDGEEAEPDREGEGPPPEAGVMDPDDLEIRDRDGVDEAGDGRYVISTGDERVPDPADATAEGHPPRGATEREEAPESDDLSGSGDRHSGDGEDAGPERRDDLKPRGDDTGPDAGGEAAGDPLEAVAAELDALSASHGFALAVAAGGETDTLRVASGEPADTLETALRWYARRINPGAPPEETVATLLADSGLDAR